MDMRTNIVENLNCYNVNNSKLGNAVIFFTSDDLNESVRNAINENKIRLTDILDKYGFEVKTYDGLNYIQIISVLKQISQEDHSQNDCFLTVIISDEMDFFNFFPDLVRPFIRNDCTLNNKPKLFFIDANKKKKILHGRICTDDGRRQTELFGTRIIKDIETYLVPRTADWFIHFSIFQDNRTLYNNQRGSWFIQSLSDTLENYLKDITDNEQIKEGFDIYELAIAVNRKVAYFCQLEIENDNSISDLKLMPTFSSSLTKRFAIYPKLKPI